LTDYTFKPKNIGMFLCTC